MSEKKFEMPEAAAERSNIIRELYEHRMWDFPFGERKHMVNMFKRCVDIETVYVSPKTREVDDDPKENTLFNVWIEAGPPYNINEDDESLLLEFGPTHDLRLDCGADTLEEALIKLAFNISIYYNEDGTEKV